MNTPARRRVEDAVKLLGGPGTAEALSGGTDLISRMKDYVTSPDRVVYLKDVKALAGIAGDAAGRPDDRRRDHRWPTCSPTRGSSSTYPALWQATLEVGTPQIRNMATVGGNLLQRPRCWYYRTGYGLLAMKDGKSLVREGDNRYHAIFLTDGDALFVSPSSLAVPLIALGAKATILGRQGRADRPRRGPLPGPQEGRRPRADRRPRRAADQGHDPGREGEERLVRGPAEAGARLAAGHGVGQPGDGRRHGLRRPGSSSTGSRRSPGGARPPRRRSRARPSTVETATAAGAAAVEGAKPLSMNGYKVALTKTVVKRALLAAVGNRYWEEA